MTVFELGIVAAPLVGLGTGAYVTQSEGIAVVLAGAGIGALTGAACILGPIFACAFVLHRHPEAAEGKVGLALVLLMAAAPVAPLYLVPLIVRPILGLYG